MTACVAVVLLHVSARPIYMQGQISDAWWLLGNAISSLTHWCVPVFVMLSGALLLGRRNLTWHEALMQRVPRILIVLVASIALYGAWQVLFLRDFNAARFMKSIFQGQPYYHLYFFYVMLGLYAVSPLIAHILALIDRETIGRAVLALCLISMVGFTFSTFLGQYAPDAASFAWPYLGYFILGHFMYRYQPAARYGLIVISAYVATVVGTQALALGMGPAWPWKLYFYTYFSPTVYAFAIGIFGLLLSLEPRGRAAAILAALAPPTLLVYIIHPMFMEFLRRLYATNAPELLRLKYDLPLTFVLATTLAFATAYMLRLIPLVRKFF